MLALKALLLGFVICHFGYADDKPCAAKDIKDRSVVCVCNETYCDEVTRSAPAAGTFVAYVTSEAGSRFKKLEGELVDLTNDAKHYLKIDPETTYQKIEGFGGAVTDAAAINWKNLSQPLQEYLIQSYFSTAGLEYNMLRVPIGGTDFSTRAYAYNEYPVNDTTLSNYTLADEDLNYKIPMIQEAMSVATDVIDIVATTWSPSTWMKTSGDYNSRSQLKEEYYDTYALYHMKFLELYKSHNIPIWGITTTNEPTTGILVSGYINSLGWRPSNMGKWIVENLGPMIRNSDFNETKILALDDQRYDIPVMFNRMVDKNPDVLKYIDGMAVHYYADQYIPAAIFSTVTKKYPDIFIIATEACEGSFPWQLDKVDIGSWSRAGRYVKDIIEDLNHNLVGWIDWNLCLNADGGPTWIGNYVDSPIIVFPENNEFYKQPMFYALGQFAKFIPRGSVRIKTDETKPLLSKSIKNVAFSTTKNTTVVVLYNDGKERDFVVEYGSKQLSLTLEADSVTTVEFAE